MTADPLREALIELVSLLKPDNIELTIGGGYGLVLRSEIVSTRPRASRLGIETIVRSTGDLDCFLAADIITDSTKTRRIAEVLQYLGYLTVQPHWQFSKPIGSLGDLQIDLLAADVPEPLRHLIERPKDIRRLRPKGFDKLHGRRTPEAITIHRQTTRVDASRDGREAFVRVPHPVSFILMKLFAFRDRLAQADKDYGAYHAFDILQTVDSMDRDEWEQARAILADPDVSSIVAEARQIVGTLFATTTSEGSARLFDYARSRQGIPFSPKQLQLFIQELNDLLAT